ncbi:PREDICTED: protein YIPF5 homolog [Dufourea novaeangliae]|uniref:protein YIPF5 homolog n=1 Tax=Dufourea novaeangliae TaxID=178035 RepID=UPI0007673755|nr:PREDICTED: protein YIPF5 homolog [Dufourea novaeangliae]
MSGYTGQDNYWGQPVQGQYNFEPSDFGQSNQQLEFQTYSDQQTENYSSYNQKPFLNHTQNAYSGDMFNQDDFTKGSNGYVDEEDEPPLLEELGIDPKRILQKTLAVLNPFHKRGELDDANYLLQDSDLAGPVAFCLIFAACLSLADSTANFSYVYGLAVTSCIFMYILLSLMSRRNNITFSSIASVLGYCLLPVVVLASSSIFITLRGPVGSILALLAVIWATLSASRLLIAICGEENQRPLIAYPCILLYGAFTLIVVF